MKKLLIFLIVVTVAFTVCSYDKVSDMRVKELKCEYLENPLGIDVTRPRLSWILESSVRGQKQTAYRILVASSEEILESNIVDLWDSGKVMSDRSVHVVYEGTELRSRLRCYWKVCAWDKDGAKTEFSEPVFWSIGLLSDTDWKGKWIAKEETGSVEKNEKGDGPPPPFFRKTFSLDKKIHRATIYATARGIFELYINAKRVGEDIFAPEFTDYDKRIHYRTYDVTSLLNDGRNAIGVILGEGWFSGYAGYIAKRGHYGFQNSLLVQLEVEYTDGSRQVIATDDTWQCSEGPILGSDMFMGEYYDARSDMPGWDTSDFDDSSWKPAVIVRKFPVSPPDADKIRKGITPPYKDEPEIKLVSQPSQPVRITGHINPVNISEPKKGVYVFDMGQNMVGWTRLRVKGEAGTKITLRFAERLNLDGTIYTINLRHAKSTDTYILKGGEEEVFEPRFTFHGFQYVEMTGFPGVPGKDAITGCVVHSDTPTVGKFECSDSIVNKLWQNITWGQRGNFLSIPTDCPQRDERMGWMGDAQIFMRTATYNMDVAAFFTKWMNDIVDGQSTEGAFPDVAPYYKFDVIYASPGWADAGVIVPWTIYRVYGDTRIIEKNWVAMKRWMDFLLEANPDLIRKNRVGNNYGDWLSIEADTPKEIMATAYWAYDAKIMAEMARAIGLDGESGRYEKLFKDIRAAFQENYINPDGHVYPVHGLGEETGQVAIGHKVVMGKGETQTGYLMALYMDLLPEELRLKAAEYLVEDIRSRDRHLSTGFHGCRFLNPVLTTMGYNEIAYHLLLNDTFPSWGYSIKHGATTIWERWDGWTEEKGFQNPGMNSFNHYSFGAVSEWLYRFVAGIDLDTKVPGYKHIVIKPYPCESLDFARAEYKSIHGTIKSGWRWNGDSFILDVTIPANTTARIYIPAEEGTQVTEAGKPADKTEGISFAGYGDGFFQYNVRSGTYNFKSILLR